MYIHYNYNTYIVASPRGYFQKAEAVHFTVINNKLYACIQILDLKKDFDGKKSPGFTLTL